MLDLVTIVLDAVVGSGGLRVLHRADPALLEHAPEASCRLRARRRAQRCRRSCAPRTFPCPDTSQLTTPYTPSTAPRPRRATAPNTCKGQIAYGPKSARQTGPAQCSSAPLLSALAAPCKQSRLESQSGPFWGQRMWTKVQFSP